MPLMPGTQDVAVDPKGGPLPVTRVKRRGRRLHPLVGRRPPAPLEHGADRLHAPTPPPCSPRRRRPRTRPKFKPPTHRRLAVDGRRRRQADRHVALTGARIVTMASRRRRDHRRRRDRRPRRPHRRGRPRAARSPIPAGAKTVDVDRQDDHPRPGRRPCPRAAGRRRSRPAAELVGDGEPRAGHDHDPRSLRAAPREIFAASEMQRAGKILAPRIFSTGEIIYGAKAADVYAEINSLDDALAHVRRLKAQGALSVKNYNQPRREQRQMVVAAAQREGMEVVPEGGSLYTMDMTLIQDGNCHASSTISRSSVFYDDSSSFWTQTKTNYTPTLVVTYGGPAGDPYWRAAYGRVAPSPAVAPCAARACSPPQNARRTMAPEEDYVDDDSAREAKKLADRGVQVSIGAHGQQAGPRPALGDVVVRPRRLEPDRGASRRRRSCRRPSLGYAARRRLARGRQARRPGRARRRSDRRHPQQRQGPPGDARRPALRPGDHERGRDREPAAPPYWWEAGQCLVQRRGLRRASTPTGTDDGPSDGPHLKPLPEVWAARSSSISV